MMYQNPQVAMRGMGGLNMGMQSQNRGRNNLIDTTQQSLYSGAQNLMSSVQQPQLGQQQTLGAQAGKQGLQTQPQQKIFQNMGSYRNKPNRYNQQNKQQRNNQGGSSGAGGRKDSNWIRNNMAEFQAMSDADQKQLLGILMFEKVSKVTTPQLSPKVTGMLIDLEVLDLNDVLEILESQDKLKDMVNDARQIIEEAGQAGN